MPRDIIGEWLEILEGRDGGRPRATNKKKIKQKKWACFEKSLSPKKRTEKVRGKHFTSQPMGKAWPKRGGGPKGFGKLTKKRVGKVQ